MIYEDIGSLCIDLTLQKPAFFDTTIQVIELAGNASGKLCNSYYNVLMYVVMLVHTTSASFHNNYL